MENRSGSVLAVAILFFILSWVSIALRVYVRAGLLKQLGKDDYWMLTTLALFTPYLACQITTASYGTGRHMRDLDPRNARIALKYWYICEVIYALGTCTLKIALGVFYLRVTVKKWHVWVIKFLMAGTVLFGSIYFFIAIFQCTPISSFWDIHPASNKCIPHAPALGITYALGSINAFADWVLGILPLFIVWDLQMNARTKIMVVGLLAFAAIGGTATVVRLQYIPALNDEEDFLWSTTDLAIWATVELGIGITAGCIATLRPLLRMVSWKFGLTLAPSSAEIRAKDANNSNRLRYHHSITTADDSRLDQTRSTIVSVSGPPKRDNWTSKGKLYLQPKQPQTRAEDEEYMVGDGINESVSVERPSAIALSTLSRSSQRPSPSPPRHSTESG